MGMQDELSDWSHDDAAMHSVATALGILPMESSVMQAKYVYWSKNALGNALHKIVQILAEVGYLEARDEPDVQYRLNADFQTQLNVATVWRDVAGSKAEP